MQSRISKAFASLNLSSLGFAPDKIKKIANDWEQRQDEQSLAGIQNGAAQLEIIDDLDENCRGKLFISFHYSVYPALFHALGRRSTDQTVYSLIGSQTEEHRIAVEKIADSVGIHIHFVESSPRLLREMRNGLNDGHAGILLCDIPWSSGDTAPDIHYPTINGAFQSLSALERLATLIDRTHEFAFVYREKRNRIHLTSRRTSFNEAFAAMGEQIYRDPADYERLHQIHRFFVFERKNPSIVTFRIKEQRYAIASPSMRVVRVKSNATLDRLETTAHGTCTDQAILSALSEALGEAFEYIICL